MNETTYFLKVVDVLLLISYILCIGNSIISSAITDKQARVSL